MNLSPNDIIMYSTHCRTDSLKSNKITYISKVDYITPRKIVIKQDYHKTGKTSQKKIISVRKCAVEKVLVLGKSIEEALINYPELFI